MISDLSLVRWFKPNHLLGLKCLFIILLQVVCALPQSAEHQQTSNRPNNGGCRVPWQRVANKCIKIIPRATSYEHVKTKCSDIPGSQIAIVDDSTSEREASSTSNTSASPFPPNLTAFLSQNELQNRELLSRQFYINISSNLLEQYRDLQELGESETTMSDLWFPLHEQEFSNITGNLSDTRDYTAFALAYSKRLSRWGIIPVNPTRKFSGICERQPTISSIQIDHANREHKQRNQSPSTQENNSPTLSPSEIRDFNQPSNIHATQPNNAETRKALESTLTSTTPQPEMSSMLFREISSDKSAIFGSTVELKCSSLESESTITWSYKGKELGNPNNRIKVSPSGTLRIDHVKYTDEGNYTCKISSPVSSESKNVKLEIVGRPHQPEGVIAELLDKLTPSVRIKWLPGFDGYSPILKYTVEMKTVNSDTYETEIGNSPNSNWEVARVNISADQTSVIINELKPARKYIFRVRAINRIGISEPSSASKQPIEVPVQPPSLPPVNLTGTAKNSTSIALQWSPPPVEGQNGFIKGYKIRHKLAGYSAESDWYTNDVNDGGHQSFVLDDLMVWENYEIQVAAENEKDVGPFTGSIYVKTKEGTPDKGPLSVSSESLNSSSIRVSWLPPLPQHINGVNQGYRVQVWVDVHQTQMAKELVVAHNSGNPQHSAVIEGLLPYTEYYICVKCFTNAGDGPPNEETVKIRTKQDYPEAVASFEIVDVLDKSLKLLWKPPIRVNGELDHYTLEYSEIVNSLEGRKVTRTFGSTVNEAIISDLIPQTSYSFKIYAHTGVGPGPGRSSQITTSVPPVLPEAPSNLVYSNVGPTSVTIDFNPGFDGNAVIDKWIVEALPLQMRNADYQPHQRWQNVYVSTNHTKRNSIIVRNLKPFTRYKIRLSPVNIVGQSRFPSDPTAEFQTAQMEPERPPKELAFEDVTSTSVTIRWQPLQPYQWLGNPVGYNLTWMETNNPSLASFSLLINDSKVDSSIIKNLEEFTEYSFIISALNEAGPSPQSEPVTLTTLEDVPSAGPLNLTAHAISYNAISVDWNTIPKRHRNGILRGYKIQYQALRADAPLLVKTVEDNTTRHVTLNDLKAFTTYHLAVAAFTSAGDGVYSNVLNIKTHEDTPGTPQNLSSPTISQTTARILWDPPAEPNGEILGYKVSYHPISDGGNKEVFSQELHQNERTYKAENLKPESHYLFTVTAKTKEGWGQQANTLVYTYDSELRANLPFYRESWFVILCACSSIVITIIITALLFVQTKSYKYKQDAIKQSTSHDRLGDAGFTIDDELATGTSHYNNGFGLLTQNTSANHRRSNGALSQSTANFTLPKTPPRPHLGSVVYSDEGDDDVFEDVAEKGPPSIRGGHSRRGTSNYDENDSSGDSLTEKPSEISSSPAPDSETADDDDYATKHFTNHYANVSLRNQKSWRRNTNAKYYAPSTSSTHSRSNKPKLPQRPVPSVPHVPGSVEINSSGSDNTNGNSIPGTSGFQRPTNRQPSSSIYGESSLYGIRPDGLIGQRDNMDTVDGVMVERKPQQQKQQQQADQLLNGQSIVNLNGGRIIVDNMAGSRAPLPGFTSFV